jgi:hypothetical protein
MSPIMKNVLYAILWFVLGHLSCAVMHHFHHHEQVSGIRSWRFSLSLRRDTTAPVMGRTVPTQLKAKVE